ncbi:thioredoxin domain-containing protein [Solemya velesiana gill symbiont]|uniref:Spermatogenesis-associated protein 20-like TRX domain-containing protein n=1 Tax=Solemya velesiana gill symbiont TaxID=1918948 RepID=A0A1T2KUF3_9GAMM|nr:DUF255 domain-containing protein [Solemya velesiana gill symbiont]OOZ36336.1 hypothetical protein BOW51_07725 [Solemya velesiana gill symbiont]
MARVLAVFLALLFTLSAQGSVSNQLKDHPSPYLALHGNDPVHWQAWGAEVLERARRENKLIFIASGYFACHWCHVMQRESYQDPEIARFLNTHFIPVKVDRELQPTLDAHLINFVEKTRGSAGWPLNVFLTPEGYPLVGLTYAPPKPFMGLLEKLETRWAERADDLKEAARLASLAMKEERVDAKPLASIDAEGLHVGLVTMALALGDEMEGGLGMQPRFPMAPQWSALIDRLSHGRDEKLAELISLTLDQMAKQGLRDHIGGGFFRYTVDPSWQVPHYEKMLYTQALLSQLYLKAAHAFGRSEYKEVARDTLDFALRELKQDNGGFIASLSAVDEDDEEGGGYLWRDAQLKQALSGQELQFARKRWRLEGTSPTEGGYLPVDHQSVSSLSKAQGADLSQLEITVKRKLLKARESRKHPQDTKQLAAWNGLMLLALVDGAREFGDARYRKSASDLRDFLVNRLWNGERLFRARDGKRNLGSAAMEDYVYVAAGLHAWSRLSGSKADYHLSRTLVKQAWDRYFTADGWQSTDESLVPGIASEQAMTDGPLPSPAAMLIELSFSFEDKALVSKAKQALTLSYPVVQDQPIWYASHIQALMKNPL